MSVLSLARGRLTCRVTGRTDGPLVWFADGVRVVARGRLNRVVAVCLCVCRGDVYRERAWGNRFALPRGEL